MVTEIAAHEPETLRKRLDLLWTQLDTDWQTFRSHYQDIADNLLPRRARFTTSDVNRGDKRNQKIKDSTATLALRTLGSGMMAGLTSPARPWFRLTTPDPAMAEDWEASVWLDTATRRLHWGYHRSNLYKAIPIVYKGICFEEAFRADLVAADKVIIELKSVTQISRAHRKQIQT